MRPYAKYAEGPGDSVLITFSDGHPASFRSSLYFLRYAGGRFTAADGREIGTLADLPLRFDELDPVDATRAGRAAHGRWTSRQATTARR